MQKNFEHELPQGYKEVFRVNAKETKTATIFALTSFIPLIILFPIAIAIVIINEAWGEWNLSVFVNFWTAFFIPYIIYIVLHELLHGITYKLFTKQKLTFGITLTCAYCGVPNIFVYRKASIWAVIMPFVVFSVVFISTTIILYFINSYLFLASVLLLSLHLGGCVGDLYCLYLFLFKFKDSTTLIRDTGPEMFFYVNDSQE